MSEERNTGADTRTVGVGNSASRVKGAVVQIEKQHGDTTVGPAYHGPVEKSDVHIHQPAGRSGSGPMWLLGTILLVVLVAAAVLVSLEHERLSARQPVAERPEAASSPSPVTPTPAPSSAPPAQPSRSATAQVSQPPARSSPVAPPASEESGLGDCGPTAHPVYSGSYRGCEIKNGNMGEKTHFTAGWGDRGKTLLVIGWGYELYVADNDGPFSSLGKVAASGGGGLFFTYARDGNSGYLRFLATDSKRYCLTFTAAPAGSGKPAARGDWYVC
ncbi:hypothetical protein [Amycolatopsis samaneae]|uniref:Serine/threonine protein kinase n=1 Tax=Amycolatopsis samaneae TaxID=664691 RepID=A0ABW5GDZ1_9PSEU